MLRFFFCFTSSYPWTQPASPIRQCPLWFPALKYFQTTPTMVMFFEVKCQFHNFFPSTLNFSCFSCTQTTGKPFSAQSKVPKRSLTMVENFHKTAQNRTQTVPFNWITTTTSLHQFSTRCRKMACQKHDFHHARSFLLSWISTFPRISVKNGAKKEQKADFSPDLQDFLEEATTTKTGIKNAF